MAKKAGEIVPLDAHAGNLIPSGTRESLTAWVVLYMGLEAGGVVGEQVQGEEAGPGAVLRGTGHR